MKRDTVMVWGFGMLLTALCLCSLAVWFYFKPDVKLEQALPGKLYTAKPRVEKVDVGAFFEAFPDSDKVLERGSDWPCFRGEARSNRAEEPANLIEHFTDSGPRILWRMKLGEGYAAPAVWKGRGYLLDYDETLNRDCLTAFALHTGKVLWKRSYPVSVRRNHGKSRTVPAVASGVVVSLGPKGHVMGVDAVSGDLLWSCDLVREYAAEIPQWYAGQCPLIDNGAAVLAPAGDSVLLTALDLRTGKTLWETPNPGKFKMSHASVMPMNLSGTRTYVVCGIGGMAGADENGRLLWFTDVWKPAVWAPSPVALDETRIFVTAGYGAGSAVLKVVPPETGGSIWTVSLISRWNPRQGPACEQQTPIVWQNRLWTLLPKDAAVNREQLCAANLDNPQKITVLSGREHRFGLGPFLLIGDCFYILDDEGVLSVMHFENEKLLLRDQYKVLPGHDAWGPLAFADGILLVRDLTSMAAIDLKQENQP